MKSTTNLPTGSSIDPSTGVITGPNLNDGGSYQATITASNSCGSTSQDAIIRFSSN
ncbi:MAG: putative Ig domain-containing protein [Verrucomicrobia bacterium]|nr:putative Ig domain-containing protein [Verrucomicrobiota bacterium]